MTWDLVPTYINRRVPSKKKESLSQAEEWQPRLPSDLHTHTHVQLHLHTPVNGYMHGYFYLLRFICKFVHVCVMCT